MTEITKWQFEQICLDEEVFFINKLCEKNDVLTERYLVDFMYKR